MWHISIAIIMIEFNNNKEKELLVYYVNKFDQHHILNIIESGIGNEKDAIELARFYWRIVDETRDDKSIEYCLEKLYTTLLIHFGNAGYLTVWDREIP